MGVNLPYADKDEKNANSRIAYARLMGDPERREHRNRRHAAYMRDYYRTNADHRARVIKRRKQWVSDNREFANFQHSLRRYGITLDQFHARLEQQQEQCAICEAADHRLVIDHCHLTGRFRGLLCQACNSGIGALKESKDVFARALRYLSN